MGLKPLKTLTFHLKHYPFTIISINGSWQFQFYRFGKLNGSPTLFGSILGPWCFLWRCVAPMRATYNFFVYGTLTRGCPSMNLAW